MSSSDNTEPILQLWDQCSQILMAKFGANAFKMMSLGRGSAFPVSLDEKALTLGFPPDTLIDWLDINYKGFIEEALSQVTGKPLKVVLEKLSPETYAAFVAEMRENTLPEETKAMPAEPAEPSASAPSIVASPSANDPRLANLNSNYTFNSFVVGPSNQFAYNACYQIAQHPGQECNPLFIHGPSGLGKTHLMQAIARKVCQTNAKAVVEYMTSERFGNLYVEACLNKAQGNLNMVNFRRHFRNVDVLLIDDVQFFAGKEGMQEEFFHTFEELYNNHKQIVLASDRIPEELAGLNQRLTSRFAWGVTVDITLPDISTRVAILKEKQQDCPIKLSADIIEYLANRVRTNVRTLESCLRSLQAFISLSREAAPPVDKQLVDKLCGSHFDQDASLQISLAYIQEIVAHHYDVRVQDLRGKSRQAEINTARQIAMYLGRELTDKSYPAIAAAFEKTHPTVMHALQVVEQKMNSSEEFRQTIADITRKIKGDKR